MTWISLPFASIIFQPMKCMARSTKLVYLPKIQRMIRDLLILPVKQVQTI